MTAILLAAMLLQDPAPLVEKLRADDAVTAENARRDLLALGEKALPAIREAASKAEEGAFRDVLTGLVERLETRARAARLPRTWGDRWYGVYAKALKVGWAHLKVTAVDGGLRLDDEIFVRQGEGELRIKVTATCRANEYLTPTAVTINIDGPAQSVTLSGKLKGNRIVVDTGAGMKAMRVPENFTIDFAVLRLLTILPGTKGYDVTALRTVKPQPPVEGTIACEREEAIDFEGRLVKVRRYMFSDGEKDRFYWVDGEHRLLRLQSEDEVEILLEDEKRAKELD